MADGDLTPREVAERLGVTVRTVQRWVASGTLAATRVGGRVRVSRSSLAALSAPASAPQDRQIRTLLVANRGEIAARMARAARSLGIRAIGVVEDGDRRQPGMDAAHPIRSYLDAEELLAVARLAGADALHPGYGFLAENAEFARAVTAAGLLWVGPPPDAIAAVGDKATARRRAAEVGVPVLAGYDHSDQGDATLAAEAERIGFPLLVKPSAGGGGKGMRMVNGPGELGDALAAARREARRAFGDDRLILERYLPGARHVEVQVLFDGQGAGVHLGERDCSAQRRSQKIVEEAPAPSVAPDLRERMGEAALRVAGSVGYESAGTVEMLLADSGDFFFLEMNARLQVEHPVTEEVTGRDIVADQLRIANGQSLATLGLGTPPRIRGHAIEARLYAEDPEAGFLPASGRLLRLQWPPGVRIDTGVEQGDAVTDRYDPMIAKLIAHGRTRSEALDRLRAALDATTVLGVRTNLRFLRWLLDQPAMHDGEMRTDTVGRLDLPTMAKPTEDHWRAAADALWPREGGPWAGGWRLNAAPVLRLRHEDEERTIALGGGGTEGTAVVAEGVAHVDVEGQSLEFRVAPAPSVEEAARHAASSADGGTAVLSAPMPGRVISVRVAEGDQVAAHAPVVIIEAMKMEHAVVAPIDGRVARLAVAEGQQVQRGDRLADIEPYHAGDAT
ncbi:MAG: biotin carboxylase N-terminal domain-containing protein [Chloroflexota bacterium]